MIPEDIQKGGKAVHRLGFTGQIASLATRPKMLRQLETINAVYEYIRLAPTKNKLRLKTSCASRLTRSKHTMTFLWTLFPCSRALAGAEIKKKQI